MNSESARKVPNLQSLVKIWIIRAVHSVGLLILHVNSEDTDQTALEAFQHVLSYIDCAEMQPRALMQWHYVIMQKISA